MDINKEINELSEKLKNSGELLYKGIDFVKSIKATVPF